MKKSRKKPAPRIQLTHPFRRSGVYCLIDPDAGRFKYMGNFDTAAEAAEAAAAGRRELYGVQQ